MALAGIYNLCLDEGSTFNHIFRLRHRVQLTAGASVGVTTLNVAPLATEYTANTTLTFNGVAVTLAAFAGIGAEALTINNALTTALTTDNYATGNPVDLTGRNVRSKVKDGYSDSATTLADLTCTIPTPATNGIITVSLAPGALIDNIAPLLFHENFAATWATRSTALTSDELKLFNKKNPYVWDIETFTTADDVIRHLNGYVAVTSEATFG